MTYSQRVAKALLDIHAVTLNPDQPFTWASGLKSPIYTDNRLTISYPEVRQAIFNGMVEQIKLHFSEADVIAGTATAGIPHAAWVAQNMELPMIYVRTKPKDHGQGKQIEGILKEGQKVVVIDDLISTVILPALATAMFITRRPADFLSIRRSPAVETVALVCLALVLAIPFMNLVISWNANIVFPEWAAGAAEWMRTMEDAANATLMTIVDGQSIMSLIILILTVGIFAGFSEELFFRGCLQRLMITARVNPHVAIWLTAILFSAIHMQFFGFVPRLLLGALFGYLAWWSGSVWTAVAAHIFNNTLAAVTMWMKARDASSEIVRLESFGANDILAAAVSLLLTLMALFVIYQLCQRRR